jgi:hypothetical protein
VTSISNVSGSNYSDYQASGSKGAGSQRRAEFEQLTQDIQSGDLTDAQQAFSALQQNAPAGTSAASGQSGNSNSPMDALAQALQSGDLTGAQQALAKIQQGHGRGHHHHGGDSGETQAVAQPGSLVNVTA